MKRQTRPFIVEVKHKRGRQKPRSSIWGDLDLSTIVAGTAGRVQHSPLVDSEVTVIDAETVKERRLEQVMADTEEAQTTQIATEPRAKPTSSTAAKKTVRPRKAKSKPIQAAAEDGSRQSAKSTEAPALTTRATRRTYSREERAQKLSQIEKAIAGGATIKNAVGQADISEQTYYHWKKSASPVTDGGDLKDLLALEEENKRLKSLLAERLRKENAELKKKLGL